MPVTIPENINNWHIEKPWHKIENQGRQLFKMHTPRVSERNGPICCYRIFVIKLAPQTTLADLPSPQEISVYPFKYVHSSPLGGAYLAEMFDNNQLPAEVFIGDEESFNGSLACQHCVGLKQKPKPIVHYIPEVCIHTFLLIKILCS